MQKIEFQIWNGKMYVMVEHNWQLEEITVNKAQVVINWHSQADRVPVKVRILLILIWPIMFGCWLGDRCNDAMGSHIKNESPAEDSFSNDQLDGSA